MKKHHFARRAILFRRMISRNLFRVLGNLNVYLQPEKRFYIKAGYHSAVTIEAFDDSVNTDEWQRTVYEEALNQMKKLKGNSVIDVGCGSGYKLMKMFGNYQTLGIELSDTYQWLLTKYPSGNWLDFEQAGNLSLTADVVICSDVIEHVQNPDRLMNFLKKIKFSVLVLSTPERDAIRGVGDFGPPENPAHFREWNKQEFNNYASGWFKVTEQLITSDKSISQVLFCRSLDEA
jgi:ubiquinone/menaquinone biosynthesis C-methylase UbiE